MSAITLVQAVNQALREEMRRDERVIVFGEDVGKLGSVFRATEGLLDEFGPDRVIDTPLAGVRVDRGPDRFAGLQKLGKTMPIIAGPSHRLNGGVVQTDFVFACSPVPDRHCAVAGVVEIGP